MLDAFLIRLPILPIDTGRYGSPEMRHIFDEESKLQKWLDVEAAVAEAEASVGDIPREAADDIAENANTKTVTLARTKEIEKETRRLALRDKTPEETLETGPRTGSRWKNPRHCRDGGWAWKERVEDPGESTKSSRT